MCYACWKQNKVDDLRSEINSLHLKEDLHKEIITDLRDEIEALNDKIDGTFLDDKQNELFCRLRDLIKLCHPDKHGNSELSNNITSWLIKNYRNNDT
tara:strand:- start:168 stop:458 length:291 start_codon:yes stop_codon:yes gene_type:complete